MKKTAAFITLALSQGLIAPSAMAQANPTRALETITVIATQSERTLLDVPETVDVIDADEIDRHLARDLADLMRFEPGLSVAGTGSRYGLGGITIRGIGGNRVLTLIDGIQIAEEFSFGPFLEAKRDFVDLDALKRVEVIRGPASSLYGSDAIGGVLAFTTKDPSDYLSAEKTLAASLKSGYSSENKSFANTLSLAAGSDTLGTVLIFTDRSAEEKQNRGSEGGFGNQRSEANPQELDSQNVLLKLVWQATENTQLGLTFDQLSSDVDSTIFSDYNTVSRGSTTNESRAEDQKDRERFSLSLRHKSELPFIDEISASLYRQSSETDQFTQQKRTTATGAVQNRTRRSLFEQELSGGFLHFDKSLSTSNSDHRLAFGIDYQQVDSRGQRLGADADNTTGAVQSTFNTRDFPITKVTRIAAYFQDEIELFDGQLTLIPGLRFDDFDAKVKADSLYLNGNPGTPLPDDYADSELTAKLGGIWRFNENLSAVARIAQGFRAPPFDDVNVGFTNPLGRYKTISNTDLSSETSISYELGLRYQSAQFESTFTVFQNKYDNFISSFEIAEAFLATGGIDPSDGFLTFQSKNLDKVSVEGIELTTSFYPEALKGLKLSGTISYADGEDKTSGQPINSVDPLKGVFSASYQSESGRWSSELIWTLVASKDANDIDQNNARIQTAGYGTLDWFGHYEINKMISVDLGLFNLTDKKYLQWANTAAISLDSSGNPNVNVDRYSQPGRSGAVTLKVIL